MTTDCSAGGGDSIGIHHIDGFRILARASINDSNGEPAVIFKMTNLGKRIHFRGDWCKDSPLWTDDTKNEL